MQSFPRLQKTMYQSCFQHVSITWMKMTNFSVYKQKVLTLPPHPPQTKKEEITSAVKHRQALLFARKQGTTTSLN